MITLILALFCAIIIFLVVGKIYVDTKDANAFREQQTLKQFKKPQDRFNEILTGIMGGTD